MAMEKLRQIHQFYKRNKFVECCDAYRKLLPHLTGRGTEDLHFVLECIVTSNLNVCAALVEITKNSLRNSWEPTLKNFVSCFNNWRNSEVLSLQLFLTLGYNALHWYWMMPKSYVPRNRLYHEILDIAVECFKKVLEELKISTIGDSEQVDLEENLMFLMESVSNQIPKLNKLPAIAVIKLLNITYLIFMTKSKPNQLLQRSSNSLERDIQGIKLFEKSLRCDQKSRNTAAVSTKSGFYTFGLKHLNSILDETADACITSFFLTCILSLINLQGFEKAAEYLRGLEVTEKFNVISLYLKAFCLFQLGHSDATFMTLSSMRDLPLHNHLKFRFHILLGKYYLEKDALHEATAEFTNARNSSPALAPEATYYLFRCCQKDNLPMRMRYLEETYRSIKKYEEESESWKISDIFETRLLNMLHATPAVSEEEALYLLAKVNLQHQKWAVAEKLYQELMERLRTNCDITSSESSSRLAPLPKIHVIYHEAIKSSIESGNLEVALAHCRTCLSDFIGEDSFDSHPTSVSQSEARILYYDDCLNSMNEDCVSLILLSQIYFQMNEDSLALDSVERCIKVVSGHIDSKTSKPADSTDNLRSQEEEIFLKCFLTKLFLCKAILLKNMGKTSEELIPLYEQALSFNSGDSDVLFYYARVLITQGQDQKAATLKNSKRFDLNPDRCFSEALKSFVQLHTSEDRWGESDSQEDVVADLFENSD